MSFFVVRCLIMKIEWVVMEFVFLNICPKCGYRIIYCRNTCKTHPKQHKYYPKRFFSGKILDYKERVHFFSSRHFWSFMLNVSFSTYAYNSFSLVLHPRYALDNLSQTFNFNGTDLYSRICILNIT